jgi:hypothetical protein
LPLRARQIGADRPDDTVVAVTAAYDVENTDRRVMRRASKKKFAIVGRLPLAGATRRKIGTPIGTVWPFACNMDPVNTPRRVLAFDPLRRFPRAAPFRIC